ncbi:VOC family protein [Psychrobacillus vulpis]|uniref:VOC family protein n=1 Tax=Psychrobacillus vulpis TaxID=2325572 RepID=A0A544TWM0_9BACI|nr:VOC family protein [Psychrobacillus vulpis]TQR21852.1 VOC family protein [Psychrobacillus vulpis]
MSHFVTRIATIEIPVSNLNNSISFYTEVLGVQTDFKGENAAMLSFHQKGVPTIYLVETKNFQQLSFNNIHSNVEHSVIDFYTPTLKDFYNWLEKKKVEVGPLNINEEGIGGFGFKDPDGNQLSACNIEHWGQ